MAIINLAIIGSGGMARVRARNFNARKSVTIAAIGSRNPESGNSLANDYGADYLANWRDVLKLPDIDGIVITTYNESHGRIALGALKAGKHVFSEYPAARSTEELWQLSRMIETNDKVYRLTHRESVSRDHNLLKCSLEKGKCKLVFSRFNRITPGKGMRPEILFNLNYSGPPALFFIYHVHPVIDLFGAPEWVESNGLYKDLDKETGAYDSFVNTLSAGWAHGGLASWTWAGGVPVHQADEGYKLITSGGTYTDTDDGWIFSDAAGAHKMAVPDEDRATELELEDLFLQDIRKNDGTWKEAAHKGIISAKVGLAAEIAQQGNRRVYLRELD